MRFDNAGYILEGTLADLNCVLMKYFVKLARGWKVVT